MQFNGMTYQFKLTNLQNYFNVLVSHNCTAKMCFCVYLNWFGAFLICILVYINQIIFHTCIKRTNSPFLVVVSCCVRRYNAFRCHCQLVVANYMKVSNERKIICAILRYCYIGMVKTGGFINECVQSVLDSQDSKYMQFSRVLLQNNVFRRSRYHVSSLRR